MRRLRFVLLTSSALGLGGLPAAAQDATWNLNGTGDFNAAGNWTPNTVPGGTAFFGTSNQNNISFSVSTTIGGWTFNSGASAYSLTNSGQILDFSGAGIVINGGSAAISNLGLLNFNNSSTAGGTTIDNQRGTITFFDTSTAGTAAITNTFGAALTFNAASTAGGAVITNSNGTVDFNNSATAGSSTITNNVVVRFSNTSTAGSSVITNNSGAVSFLDATTAGSAAIINNGIGTVRFGGTSTAGNAAITNNSGGVVDFSASSGPNSDHKLSAGSIAGAGTFQLGSNQLTVGGNSQSTAVSGVIADGGSGGSLVKVGTGTLTLTGSNTYSGGTTVTGGFINFSAANNLGSGAITLNGGGLQWASGTSTDISSQLAAIGGNGATFDTNSNNVAFASTLTGGRITKAGDGTLTLSGTNTYSGGTTVTAGALQVTTNSSVGSGDVTLNGGTFQAGAGNLTFTNNFNLGTSGGSFDANGTTFTISGNITGQGMLTTLGSTLVLTGTNSYTGGTTILASSTLQLGDATHSATIIGAVNNSGTFKVVNNTAGITSIINSGLVTFGNSSTAGTGPVINNASGGIFFNDTSTAGSTTITNNGRITFSNTSTAGSATITNNSLDIIFFNDASSAGSATITNNGGIFFSNSSSTVLPSTAGSAAIINNEEIEFERNSTAANSAITNSHNVYFFSNSTAGNAALTNNSSGLFDFSASTGPNNDGRISAGSIAGGGTFSLGSNQLTVGGNNLSTAVSGVIADGGILGGGGSSLVKVGTGTLTLTGSNTYSGGTTVTGGFINFSAANNFGSGAITLNGGGLQWASGTSTDISFQLAPIGGNGAIFDTNGANVSFAFSLSGSGGVTKTGAGTLMLSGTNTHAGTTTVNNGTLEITSGGSITQSGSLTNSADFVVDGGGSATFGSVTNNATGAITVAAGGTVHDDLNNAGTVTNNGVYVANVAGNTGTITNNATWTGAITTSGTFTNTAGATVSGLVTNSGTGSNAGTLSSGLANTGGTFNNSGTINGTTTISGGTFFGAGSVNTLSVASGGSFAPGNGTPGISASVSGSLAFQSGASYLIGLNFTTASFANVTGTATLGGASVLALFANGSSVAKQYTILTASGGVLGTFGSVVNTNLPSGFKTGLSYDANDAFLNLSLAFASPPGSVLSPNQQAVGDAVTHFFNSNGSIPLVFGGLTSAGLTQLSGETATGSQQTTFDAMTQFMNLMTDPFVAGRGDTTEASGGANAYEQANAGKRNPRDALAAIYAKAQPVAFEARWSTWAAGFGGSQTTDGNTTTGSSSATSRIYGTAVGADYRFSPFTIAGFSLAGGGTNFSVNNLGSGRSDLFQAGAYVRHTAGNAYITGALAYGWQDITTNRTVTIAGIDQLRAEFDANAYSGRVEGGYRFVAPWVGGIGITPYAAGQFTTFDLPAYAESVVSGSGAFALAYGAKSVTDSRSELGLRTDKAFAMADGIVTLRGRVAWAHDFDPNRNIGATFQALPGASFVVNGAAQASDSALTTASAEMKWMNGWSAAATFEGEFSNVTRSYAGKGVVRYTW